MPSYYMATKQPLLIIMYSLYIIAAYILQVGTYIIDRGDGWMNRGAHYTTLCTLYIVLG